MFTIFVMALAIAADAAQVQSTAPTTTAANTLSAYACEGSTVNITCPDTAVIVIEQVTYGRLTRSICDNAPIGTLTCQASNAFSTVSTRCQGHRSCSVLASNQFGGDPCPGTTKYLRILYFCDYASPLPTLQGTSGGGRFQAGQPATLQCSFSAVNRPTTVTWFLNGTRLIDSNSNTAIQSDGSLLATYAISAVGAPTAGQYTCQGSNANGAGVSGPAITIAISNNYLTSQLDGSTGIVKQLNGAFDQQVLLQASQGCAGIQIQFQPESAIDSAFGDYAYFDGYEVAVFDSASSAWPSDCNNQNVWIWVQISSSGFSVGTGPVIGQNVAVSTTTLMGIPDTYLGVFNFESSTQTIYLYQPL